MGVFRRVVRPAVNYLFHKFYDFPYYWENDNKWSHETQDEDEVWVELN